MKKYTYSSKIYGCKKMKVVVYKEPKKLKLKMLKILKLKDQLML